MNEHVGHEITVDEAFEVLSKVEHVIALQSGPGGNKRLTYSPGSQTWSAYLNGEKIAQAYQPWGAVNAYNEARV